MSRITTRASLAALVVALAIGITPGKAQEESEEAVQQFNAQTYMKNPPVEAPVANPGFYNMPTRPKEDYKKNTMLAPISAEAKMKAMQSGMLGNPFSLRDMMNFMVAKKKALPGISFDEVIVSLKLKANELNMRAVGHNTPYKILREIADPNSPRIEILSFCDLLTMRQILDYSLEFIAFLPCRISVVEDAKGQIWLVTLDWDVRWMDTSPNPNKISKELRERAISVRERIEEIMEAAANGDL